jgi:hypothetical protein
MLFSHFTTQTNNKENLKFFGIILCQSGAFSNLLAKMLLLINESNHVMINFDFCYALWFIKFIINNFVLKNHNINHTILDFVENQEIKIINGKLSLSICCIV